MARTRDVETAMLRYCRWGMRLTIAREERVFVCIEIGDGIFKVGRGYFRAEIFHRRGAAIGAHLLTAFECWEGSSAQPRIASPFS